MRPKVSVLIPVRQAEETIQDTLASLLPQCDESVEVILAMEGSSGVLLDRGSVKVIEVEAPAGVPQLRAEAARQARGEWIVITEDHCLFRAGWLELLLESMREHPGAVCGGPVSNARRTYIGWAQYFTRYSAFLPSHPGGEVRNLPGNNACYPAGLIAEHLDLLKDGFWEAEFNEILVQEGIGFVLHAKAVVAQNQHRDAEEFAALRFRHGRCYASRRLASFRQTDRLTLILRSPLVPAILMVRIARAVFRARWNQGMFLLVSPLVFFYVIAWGLGEFTGYVAGGGSSCTETD